MDNKESVSLLICGDLVISNRAEEIIGSGKNLLDDNTQNLFDFSDLVLANLEAPITQSNYKIDKCGPNLCMHTSAINEIKKMGINTLNLANNHIMDFGDIGLSETIKLLQDNNISYYGAGSNKIEANRIVVQKINDLKIGFMGMAEHEFSITLNNEPGANGLSIIDFIETYKKQKDEFDYLVVTLHNGAEKYPYPTPDNQKICRFLANNGADVIVCQHQHRPGAYEVVNNSLVVYGQGNFIFDSKDKKPDWWYDSLLVNIEFSKYKHKIDFSFYPTIQFNDEASVISPGEEEKERILSEFNKRSLEIKDSEYVVNLWNEYCEKNKYVLISRLLGHNRLFRVLNRFIKFTDYIFSSSKRIMIRNLVETESHREAILTVLRNHKK